MKKQITSFAFGALFLSAGLFFTGCSEENNLPEKEGPRTFNNGVFVTNEGQFQKGNGAVSFISTTSKEVERDVFMAVNNRPLGDVVQSLTEHNGKIYVVVNNSEKIEIADANTFKEAGVINGLKMPRYAVTSGNKLYVTEWVSYGASGRVAVVDLTTNTVSKTITVGQLPEKLLLLNQKLYVLNNGENTVSVINTVTDALENTFNVGDSPNSLTADAANIIWVLCGGKKVYGGAPNYALDLNLSTAGSLYKINPASPGQPETFTFTDKADMPANLATNPAKTKLYFNAEGKLFQMESSATTLPASPLINRTFSGLSVEPGTGLIYGAVTPSYSVNGKVIRYQTSGAALDSFTVAIGPNNFLFR